MSKFFAGKINIILVLAVVACTFLLVFGSLPATGKITSGNIPSNVTISRYLAIAFGTNLSKGIQFGTVNFLPATNIPAEHNNDSANNGTTYTILVSNDSNTPVDFCISADKGLTDAALDVIGLGNETYAAYNTTNSTYPKLSSETPMTTSYVKAQQNIGVGNQSYWRFWLDIPSSQPAGNYNNSVSFEGVTASSLC